MVALERLRADVDDVAAALAMGRAALPQLVMGTDAESLVHVGMDQRGEVVRLDLDPQWRATLSRDGLAGAVSDALQQAAQVRTGDWAAAVALAVAGADPGPAGAPRTLGTRQPVEAAATPGVGPVRVHRDSRGPVVSILPGWLAETDDAVVRDALLAALTTSPEASSLAAGARPLEVGALAARTRAQLLDSAETLPRFMRGPIQDSVERVHDDVAQVLSLPLASEGLASGELGAYADRLHGCLRLIDRPAGLPEASDAWTASAAGLVAGLAAAHRSPRPMLSRLRRRAPA